MSDAPLVSITLYLTSGESVSGECRADVAKQVIDFRFKDPPGVSLDDIKLNPLKAQNALLDFAAQMLTVPIKTGAGWQCLRVSTCHIVAILTPSSLEKWEDAPAEP